ncbi:inositol phosphatase [Paenibacillus swuensis]|uniref:Inositol phosphatase n=1 Tax=Paenibacillus swuensis TaxID=1178515 RepID=A0A172TMZ2_9BACL|nr:inositol monophosphatase family protein [Paenibacillus swuensis]ANE48133.1 inositol phosphatase [Paenibacillus swuensis]
MHDHILSKAKTVAVNAAREAGQIQKKHFESFDFVADDKGDHGDIVTEVDLLAERVILTSLKEQFPNHQIRSEETGWIGVEGDWLWLVDPLDGTNNFAIGLPLFGVSLTLLYRQKPVLGVIYETITDKLYIAEQGRGATCNGQQIELIYSTERKPRKMTVGWIQGHAVQKDAGALLLRQFEEHTFKRILRLWAPTLVWCMLAKGTIDGIIVYNSEGDDLYSGVLMVKEAGGVVMDFEGKDFTGMSTEPYLIACHPRDRELMLQLVSEGVKPL